MQAGSPRAPSGNPAQEAVHGRWLGYSSSCFSGPPRRVKRKGPRSKLCLALKACSAPPSGRSSKASCRISWTQRFLARNPGPGASGQEIAQHKPNVANCCHIGPHIAFACAECKGLKVFDVEGPHLQSSARNGPACCANPAGRSNGDSAGQLPAANFPKPDNGLKNASVAICALLISPTPPDAQTVNQLAKRMLRSFPELNDRPEFNPRPTWERGLCWTAEWRNMSRNKRFLPGFCKCLVQGFFRAEA